MGLVSKAAENTLHEPYGSASWKLEGVHELPRRNLNGIEAKPMS